MWRLSESKRRLSCVAGLLMIVYLALYHLIDFRNFYLPNLMIMDGGENTITIPLSQAMSGEIHLKQEDERVIKYILETGLLMSPSKLAYNLSHPNEDYGGHWGIQPPMLVIRKVLRGVNMTDGFFVECGAYDGETQSNTLYLERKLGWKGLLVEGFPDSYEKLKSKNRKAWLANTCLSIHPYPHRARFHVKSDKFLGNFLNPEAPKLDKFKEVEIQCVPLFSLLSAINVTTVDYFSLDVDGLELEILKTIPFDKVFIKTLTVEHSHDKDQILEFMKNKGYIDMADSEFGNSWKNDFLFVHEKVTNIKTNPIHEVYQYISECFCERPFFYPLNNGRHTLSSCSDEGTLHTTRQKVVTFTMYYENKLDKRRQWMYKGGIQFNLKRMRELYPGHTMRLYTDVALEGDYCNFVCNNSDLFWCDIRKTPNLGDLSKMYFRTWRFLTLGDPTVEYFLSRDLDSVVTDREAAVVDDWLQLSKPIHLMRDMSDQVAAVLAGLWGARNDLLGVTTATKLRDQIIRESKVEKGRYRGTDQAILRSVIFYPRRKDIVAYDSYHCKYWGKFTIIRPFPKQRKNVTDFTGNFWWGRNVSTPACPDQCKPEYGKDWKYC